MSFYIHRASNGKAEYKSDDESTLTRNENRGPLLCLADAVHSAQRDNRLPYSITKMAETVVKHNPNGHIIVYPYELSNDDGTESFMVIICDKEYRRRHPDWIFVVKQKPDDSLVSEVVSYLGGCIQLRMVMNGDNGDM